MRFTSLQYVTLKSATRALTAPSPGENQKQEHIEVALDNYVLLSPEAINLDEDNRKKLQQVMNAEPLAMIEYWAVDPDYDGQVFRSVWQDYRGNTDSDGDPLRVVDVFGFEAEVVSTVEATA